MPAPRRSNTSRGIEIATSSPTAFMPAGQHLTERDAHADNLLALFDFEHAPWASTAVGAADPPAVDCRPQ